MTTRPNIPKLPRAFFKWYCKPNRYEELHGDLEELFYERTERSLFKAKLHYYWDVIRCCQPYAWRRSKTINPYPVMFDNYFKTSFRSWMKNPLSSFINIVGLSVAIGICLVIYAFLEFDYSIDRFHQHKNEVYLVTFLADRNGSKQEYGMSPAPLGEMLKQDLSQVRKLCRLEDRNVVMKYEDEAFHEKVRYVDPQFLEMLTFPLKWGTSSSLADLNSIILSENISIKYFGDDNPIGKSMLMIFGEGRSKAFTITGVAKAFPDAHAIDFDFLVNFDNLKIADPIFDFHNWKTFISATLVQLDPSSDPSTLARQMGKYTSLQNEAEKEWVISSFNFVQLAELHERSRDIKNDISSGAAIEARTLLPLVGLIMLTLACFNYISMAIASAARRLKEIGVRKVIGASRLKVIFQFLTENLLITSLALIIGFLLCVFVMGPWFESIGTKKSIDLSLIDINLWVFLIAMVFLTGIASGIYPAFYISKFEATTIFRGSVRFGKRNLLTKIFLGFQLVLSCMLISFAVIFAQNTSYQAHRSWGYNPDNVLYVSVPDGSAFRQLRDEVSQNPNVLSVSGSVHHVGRSNVTTVIQLPDRLFEVNQLSVDANYFNIMSLHIIEGRAFESQPGSDKQSVIVNELFVKNMVWEEPIGQEFKIDSVRYEIIGVVMDFHHQNFFNKVQPTIFTLADESQYRFLSMQTSQGSATTMFEYLRSQWSKLFPETPFQGGFQEDVFGSYFESINDIASFYSAIAIIAMLLASLGLYGLVTINVSGRVREFSVRKVLGAGLKGIAGNILKQYMLLFAVAIGIGSTLSYMALTPMLDLSSPYHVPVNYWCVVVAALILVATLFAVVTSQVARVAKSNPVDGLNTE